MLKTALCVPFLRPKTTHGNTRTTHHSAASSSSSLCSLKWHFTKHRTPVTSPILGHPRTATGRNGDQIVSQQPGHGLSPGQHKIRRRQPLRLGHARRIRVLGHKIDARLRQLHVELVQLMLGIYNQLPAAFLSRSALLQTGTALPIR